MYSYDDEDMLKVGANSLGSERVSAGLLEHYGHYVVPNVPLSQQLVIEKQGIFREALQLNVKVIQRIWYVPFTGIKKKNPHSLK